MAAEVLRKGSKITGVRIKDMLCRDRFFTIELHQAVLVENDVVGQPKYLGIVHKFFEQGSECFAKVYWLYRVWDLEVNEAPIPKDLITTPVLFKINDGSGISIQEDLGRTKEVFLSSHEDTISINSFISEAEVFFLPDQDYSSCQVSGTAPPAGAPADYLSNDNGLTLTPPASSSAATAASDTTTAMQQHSAPTQRAKQPKQVSRQKQQGSNSNGANGGGGGGGVSEDSKGYSMEGTPVPALIPGFICRRYVDVTSRYKMTWLNKLSKKQVTKPFYDLAQELLRRTQQETLPKELNLYNTRAALRLKARQQLGPEVLQQHILVRHRSMAALAPSLPEIQGQEEADGEVEPGSSSPDGHDGPDLDHEMEEDEGSAGDNEEEDEGSASGMEEDEQADEDAVYED